SMRCRGSFLTERRLSPPSAIRLIVTRHPPRPPPFPYTTLFRSWAARFGLDSEQLTGDAQATAGRRRQHHYGLSQQHAGVHEAPTDRKSTRLNSSHVKSSYAVFCLKKKIRIQTPLGRRHARCSSV